MSGFWRVGAIEEFLACNGWRGIKGVQYEDTGLKHANGDFKDRAKQRNFENSAKQWCECIKYYPTNF